MAFAPGRARARLRLRLGRCHRLGRSRPDQPAYRPAGRKAPSRRDASPPRLRLRLGLGQRRRQRPRAAGPADELTLPPQAQGSPSTCADPRVIPEGTNTGGCFDPGVRRSPATTDGRRRGAFASRAAHQAVTSRLGN